MSKGAPIAFHDAPAPAVGGEMISVVIPVFNEEDSIPELYEQLRTTLTEIPSPFEILFVNDGSTDGTQSELAKCARDDSRIKVITLRRNFGQTAAMMAGIDLAGGEIVVLMDGDLQNDPADIPRLVSTLQQGYDVVSGWRKHRQDNLLTRKLPSHLANALISRLSGVGLHDYGCSLKAYRSGLLKEIRLYGEMHRFIPIYTARQGGRVTEIPVNHRSRRYGQSKYTLNRAFKVLLDLIIIKFFEKYMNKPIYIFGGFGILNLLVAFCAGMYAVYLKVVEGFAFIRTPLPLLVVMLFLSGVSSILMGLVAELLMRTYYESQAKPTYLIKSTLNLKELD
jgi:dolichol-phosphate mannosyltransferase